MTLIGGRRLLLWGFKTVWRMEQYMILDGFDSYMWYSLLAKWFHTNISTIYWTLTAVIASAALIIWAVYYFILRVKK